MVLSLVNMIKETKHETILVLATQGYTIAENRNYLVAQAIKNGCTHLLMVDDDMIFPENTLNKLISDEKDVVGVLANSRALPLMPVVEFFDDEKLSTADRLLGKRDIPQDVFECKAIGGGVMLIDLKIIDKLSRPWFSTEVHESGMTKIGEDSWFCYKVRDNGFTIWCDPTLTIGHIGQYIY